jgi:DNA-binding GntR family transcriptional regulator
MSNYLSLKDHVYNYISEKINTNELKANEKIDEKLIMNALKISRTPVREALIQLTSEGYIENVPRRGFIVKQIDETKAIEIYSLLGVLDGYAANLSCNNLVEKDYRTMEMLIFGMTKAIDDEDYSDYYHLQTEFHDIYTNKSKNDELIRIIHQLKKFFIKQSYHKENHEIKKKLHSSNDEHKTILQLFRDKNVAELEIFLRNKHWNVENAHYDSLE